MLRTIARRAIAAFERRWNYDMTYAHEILNGGGFAAVAPLRALGTIATYRRGVPAEIYHAARVTAAIAAGCGPCAQLMVSMAEADGVGIETLRALIRGETASLPADAALGATFARAVMTRGDASAPRTIIVRRFKMRGLASLAYGIVAAQAYPTLKNALGHASACVRLRAGGDEIAVAAAPP